MNKITKIVLTGGPCAGKSTVLEYLSTRLLQAVFVPEAARILLSGGYPVPGGELENSDDWKQGFQGAILDLQLRLEHFWAQEAQRTGKQLLVCDRGLLDGAAYMPGGLAQYLATYQLNYEQVLTSYDAVYHLESLATGDPASFTQQHFTDRRESAEEIAQLEFATRVAWIGHPNHTFFPAELDIESKAERVRQWILKDVAGPE